MSWQMRRIKQLLTVNEPSPFAGEGFLIARESIFLMQLKGKGCRVGVPCRRGGRVCQ